MREMVELENHMALAAGEFIRTGSVPIRDGTSPINGFPSIFDPSRARFTGGLFSCHLNLAFTFLERIRPNSRAFIFTEPI
jgi:hypothetical protein